MITTRQIDAGLALLGLNRSDLADALGMNKSTFNAYFTGQASIPIERMKSIKNWLESKGIDFIQAGVRIKETEVREFKGQYGFWAFYDDVYETIRKSGGQILVNNVDESLFLKWLAGKKEEHDKRMSALDNYSVKIIAREGDTNFPAKYGKIEYRWISKEKFSEVPFYLYGSKTAIIEFEDDDVWISVIDSTRINKAFRDIFFSAWNNYIATFKEEPQ